MLRFESIVYPYWRRALPPMVRPLLRQMLRPSYPIHADDAPPRDPQEAARFLVDWGVVTTDVAAAAAGIEAACANCPNIEVASLAAAPPPDVRGKVRIPAQWEPSERALISWGTIYPRVWPMHAQMAEAISQVADVEILVPSDVWARAVRYYLAWRGRADLARVHLLVLPTNDIWVRDYGPIMGRAADGRRVALNPTYAVWSQYPQEDDDAMTARWAAHHGIPVRRLALHTEGGNVWSDGRGTLIMSSQILYSNRYYERDALLAYLHSVLDFDKLIITPRLTLEVTGHVDLLCKLAADDLIFVSAATSPSTAEVLRKTKRLFERETNASGQPYRVVELPTPPLYLNWLTYQIRRAYTNALTINGCVLVPTYDIPTDEAALRIYAEHLPDDRIIPIDSRLGINGGGAVHCMTKDVPR